MIPFKSLRSTLISQLDPSLRQKLKIFLSFFAYCIVYSTRHTTAVVLANRCKLPHARPEIEVHYSWRVSIRTRHSGCPEYELRTSWQDVVYLVDPRLLSQVEALQGVQHTSALLWALFHPRCGEREPKMTMPNTNTKHTTPTACRQLLYTHAMFLKYIAFDNNSQPCVVPHPNKTPYLRCHFPIPSNALAGASMSLHKGPFAQRGRRKAI